MSAIKYTVEIPNKCGRFPIKGLNELLDGKIYDYRTKRYRNPVKRSNDQICLRAINKCMKGVKIDKPIRCIYWIYAKDKRHDRTNLYSVDKSFLDALQLAGVIKNDSWDYVYDSEFHTKLCRENPRIIIEIEEVENADQKGNNNIRYGNG